MAFGLEVTSVSSSMLRIRVAPQLTAALIVVAAISNGCSRRFYRWQADRDTDCLIKEKSVNSPWQMPSDYAIQPDPRSRFYDPSNPDFPCLPPVGPNLYSYQLPALRSRLRPRTAPRRPRGSRSAGAWGAIP